MVLGMVLGYKLKENTITATSIFQFSKKRSPLQEVLDLVMLKYVDKVDTDTLGNDAIQDMLSKLDPHSSFIPARRLTDINEDLQGNFQGIGIEFQIFHDTVNVMNVVPDGPSAKAGLMIGDKFLKVGDSAVAGKITSEGIKKLLRGPGGSTVQVEILRGKEKLPFTITRGLIPLPSLDAAYLLTPSTGYIRISKFAETTYEEFMASLEKLQGMGMKDLVLDIRSNGGGILGEAVDMADEFLSDDKLIVYTEGNHVSRQEYRAKRPGLFEKGKVVLLIDEASASASEVLAGALQDWDRAEIVGRRSFGKGLVQEQYDLSDGSALRLTVARYYTPSGRSIQKPYDKGVDDYDNDLVRRYEHGEMVNADSNHAEHGKAYKTNGGKTVYGGGGITPDYFVAADTSAIGNIVTVLYQNNVINNFTYFYYLANADKLKAYQQPQRFVRDFQWTDKDWQDFLRFAKQSGIPVASLTEKDRYFLNQRMKALIARYVWRSEGFFEVMNDGDRAIEKAVEVIGNKK
ncbi:carboxy-terminal processing protease [Flavihumibacter petaseus NBRC 106054]|uniref:Carboxy-terminal processing protease n=2 Tax=Flavihumibacter TaxID=1004301 RepID=A0A0E9MZT2_9BACT|nr:carboxy-terminal processing protease [Flavihumibacter petaseus NBRC 106054]